MKNNGDIIVKCLLEAAEKSFQLLFDRHREEFYYFTLVMLEDSVPCISAMSREALERLIREKGDVPEYYKWDYAGSPYFAFGYEEYWGEVSGLFEERFGGAVQSGEAFEEECRLWLDSMEEVMRLLDEREIFGSGDRRKAVFINAEISPPDHSNSERGKRLNPPEIFAEWERCCGEPENDESGGLWEEVWCPRLCDVILTEPVTDKRSIFAIKNALSYGGGIMQLTELCRNAPAVLLEGEPYKITAEKLSRFPELSGILSIRERKRGR